MDCSQVQRFQSPDGYEGGKNEGSHRTPIALSDFAWRRNPVFVAATRPHRRIGSRCPYVRPNMRAFPAFTLTSTENNKKARRFYTKRASESCGRNCPADNVMVFVTLFNTSCNAFRKFV